MRCVQFDDGSMESQVASLHSTDCPATPEAMANACSQPSVEYESVYSIANKCIDRGTGITLNCKATAIRRDMAWGGEPEPTTAADGNTAGPEQPSISSSAVIGIVVGGLVVCGAIIAAVVVAVLHRRRQEEIVTVRSPLKKHEKKTQSTAELEAAVNDLI